MDDRLAARLHRRGSPLRDRHPQNKPNAKIAILYQNDSYGKDYLVGFKAALGTAKVRSQIVGEEAFDVLAAHPAVAARAAAGSGADTLDDLRDPDPDDPDVRDHPALGWKPANIYVNSVSATDTFMTTAVASSSAATVNGSISAAYLKDPASPPGTTTRR